MSRSRKILVQVTSIARPYGWKASPTRFEQDKVMVDGYRIEEVGSIPWNVRKVEAEITVANGLLRTASLVDPNGMRVRSLEIKRDSDGLSFKLPDAAMYVVLE